MTAQEPMMPLYGFVEGDTMGVVVLARPDETATDLAARLVEAAGVRVGRVEPGRILVQDKLIDQKATLRSVGLGPLDRVDLVWR